MVYIEDAALEGRRYTASVGLTTSVNFRRIFLVPGDFDPGTVLVGLGYSFAED